VLALLKQLFTFMAASRISSVSQHAAASTQTPALRAARANNPRCVLHTIVTG